MSFTDWFISMVQLILCQFEMIVLEANRWHLADYHYITMLVNISGTIEASIHLICQGIEYLTTTSAQVKHLPIGM